MIEKKHFHRFCGCIVPSSAGGKHMCIPDDAKILLTQHKTLYQRCIKHPNAAGWLCCCCAVTHVQMLAGSRTDEEYIWKRRKEK